MKISGHPCTYAPRETWACMGRTCPSDADGTRADDGVLCFCRCQTEATLETIKRATLFDGVIDSFRTETELNGWKVTQGALL